MDEEDTRCRSRIWFAGEMRRILALGFGGGSSFGDLEEDGRFEDCGLGRVPLMAAWKNSRSLRLRNICVGVLMVVICLSVGSRDVIRFGVLVQLVLKVGLMEV